MLKPEHCHVNKEYQYLFVNDRWIKSQCDASSVINDYFRQIVGKSIYGPSARHFDMLSNKWYPVYVLHIEYLRTSGLDFIYDNDSVTVVFRDSNQLLALLHSMLEDLFRRSGLRQSNQHNTNQSTKSNSDVLITEALPMGSNERIDLSLTEITRPNIYSTPKID